MSTNTLILFPVFIVLLSSFLICSECAASGSKNTILSATSSLNNFQLSQLELNSENSEILTRNPFQVIQSDYPIIIYNGRFYVPEKWALLARYGFKFFVRFLREAVEYYRSQQPVEYENYDVTERSFPGDDFAVEITLMPDV